MVEGDADAVGEVLAEQGDLGVTLTEVVQHDEVGVHLHADADGFRRRAVGGKRAFKEEGRKEAKQVGGSWESPVSLLHGLLLQPVLQRGLVNQQRRIFSCKTAKKTPTTKGCRSHF